MAILQSLMSIEPKPNLSGLLVIKPFKWKDERGSFYESYNKEALARLGITADFVQDNQSVSKKNVFRGLHFQKPPYEQAKLVRVLQGSVLDVVVDLRKDSPTFKKSFQIELNEENRKQLFVPVGFAHGFLALSEQATVTYKCSSYYKPDAESGIRFNDPDLKIDWGGNQGKDSFIVSKKDLALPFLKDLDSLL